LSPTRHVPIDDVAAIVQQEILYGLAIAAFLSSATIRNEERSRRIIGVLSKAIARWQYLLGILLASLSCAAVYFLMVGLAVIWLQGYSPVMLHYAGSLFLNGVVATTWIATLALMLSVFLHPVISAAIALASAYARFAVTSSGSSLPTLRPRDYFFAYSTIVRNWLTVAVLIEITILFVIAAKLFSLRDVTVSIE
jgi:putative exporter of polyketide antibiotics